MPGVQASITTPAEPVSGRELGTRMPALAQGPVSSWRVTVVTTDSLRHGHRCRSVIYQLFTAVEGY